MKFNFFCIIITTIQLIFSCVIFADDVGDTLENIDYKEYAAVSNTKSTFPIIDAQHAIVIDAKTGRVLFEKNAHKRAYIASTTKIMTAIVALENGNLNDDVIVSKKAASVYGSTIKLKENEKISFNDLLYGLMLKSGNDAAIAIGEHIGGSLENFVDMMNQKALELQLTNTAFKTPHGLDAEGHYSTAYELAKMSQYALKNPIFSQIVSTQHSQIKDRELYNTNELLSLYPGTDGIKTGYTGKAGRCLVATVNRNNFRLISVVLNSSSRNKRAQSSMKILNYVYENYKPYTLCYPDEKIKDIEVSKGISTKVAITAKDEITLPLKESEYKALKIEIITPEKVKAPVSTEKFVGEMIFKVGDTEIAKTKLRPANDVRKKNIFDYLNNIVIKWCENFTR